MTTSAITFAQLALLALACVGAGGAAVVGCAEPARPVAPVAPVETVAIPAAPVSSTPSLDVAPPDPSEAAPQTARATDSTDGDDAAGQPTSTDANPNANPSPSPSPSPKPKPNANPKPNPNPKPNGSCAPFDRGAAARALGAVNVQPCWRPGGVSGIGHVKITYEAATGRVGAVTLDAGPFPGTPEGACILTRFRAAAVPPFCGSANVSVGKSFALH